MEKDNSVLKIPYGTRDFLPAEAAGKRVVETRLAELFAQWGYEEVVTPSIEYLDTLGLGSSQNIGDHLFKLFDKSNQTLALRHEMTTPIARLVSTRLQDSPLPLKLSYISSVFRYEQTQAGRQCEFYQAGVELMGPGSPATDAEVVALAVTGLLRSGLTEFTVCLGQVEFLNGILNQYRLSSQEQEDLKAAMERRNLVELNQLVDELNLPENAKQVLKELPLLNGGEDLLKQAYDMALNEQSRRALDNLAEIYRLLKAYKVEQYVRFDLGIIRDFSYYTGMVFEVYAPGLGYPLCGGGRYDHLLADFGTACPATGFALGIERILLAIERQKLPMHSLPRDVYVGYAAGKETTAIERAAQLREQGKSVELAVSSQTEAEARESQQAKNYAAFEYIA
ncbi:ATP phosphoribosyltransferase regulatory subunit [Selenomonas ruminantium]|uniref:ATP phosphoribosyltransferase regulatory subunit n=1 Tax=Selenomonas ruminantium TaxID=971 RepID=A0A1K1LNW5_SELRU|nr:ATP phosphoribosyltransferase regulatory subunit [Selenomonas ruminantium]SFA68981.1 ATP phosphoribosyltransferase regulatory subunit [Selenomonas ruminantium]SFW12547.1 ATP phosphoribosyltransferase regulatory subunit [Selenomonas ruminantium]